ncbi:DNA alkylation repair protein [Paenibacillus cymbidii]|uniref:DNA alkylation repair protein n=1 Tax=Paenibacillus cymbidii TaxID=1639034 RepID=UPI0010805CA0|nr:DNA alkylation repair protein [Paenibacillus cymbidii]
MELQEVMSRLEELGSEQTKRTFRNHGAPEPLFGVKIGDLKPLAKSVRKDRQLALDLFATGNSDAMYLAGLSIDPQTMDKPLLRAWARQASWYMLAETTVAGVAAESGHGRDLAEEWIRSAEEMIATCGWSTYAHYVSLTPDNELDIDRIRALLDEIAATIHQAPNRVRYTMNAFVIAVGSYVEPLHEHALQAAAQIGKVNVDVGQTACKVPLAGAYIAKTVAAGKLGKKKKTCIC